ncbi:Phenylacetic acid degradation-related protein [Oceaniovalibus guishaninsula JLT2003]|uniref:Phenylacetic acid degradation-related protein n=1 Tax=Oceaniovalibus guishaninsula JLT2003 TaxID=1231392 RepID=K2HJN4_9RHOB|nr:PaaI family thioesterase [Oceaniovalibus guishaninsula]EKE43199.1 Phenylacetic acid degradation-related protein [Oceaniovalibus guishaninsula JLT2003]
MKQGRSLDQMPDQSSFARLAGIEVVSVTADEVVCRMPVTPELANRNGALHGGAIMTLADSAAGSAAFILLPPERSNTTVEAKTNFIRGVKMGDTVTARCIPIHAGRQTMVFQITMTRDDGKVVAVTTQTHLAIDWAG